MSVRRRGESVHASASERSSKRRPRTRRPGLALCILLAAILASGYLLFSIARPMYKRLSKQERPPPKRFGGARGAGRGAALAAQVRARILLATAPAVVARRAWTPTHTWRLPNTQTQTLRM